MQNPVYHVILLFWFREILLGTSMRNIKKFQISSKIREICMAEGNWMSSDEGKKRSQNYYICQKCMSNDRHVFAELQFLYRKCIGVVIKIIYKKHHFSAGVFLERTIPLIWILGTKFSYIRLSVWGLLLETRARSFPHEIMVCWQQSPDSRYILFSLGRQAGRK